MEAAEPPLATFHVDYLYAGLLEAMGAPLRLSALSSSDM